MTIEKLKSGSFRIRQQFNGVRYSVTIDHKPSQKEATLLIAKEIEKSADLKSKDTRLTFAAAADRYIAATEGVLSPSTIAGYAAQARYISRNYSWFAEKHLSEIRNEDVQAFISEYAKGKDKSCRRNIKHRSTKTVKVMYGFIRVVLKMFLPALHLDVIMPKKESTPPYIPTDEDMQRIFEALDTPSWGSYKVPIALAAMGMRRSEICAAELEDLTGDTLFIHRAKVLDKDKTWIVKDYGKTPTSTRCIDIPREVAEKIRAQGYIYKGYPGNITKALYALQKELGIPRFSVHKLRHYYASSAIALNVPITYIQRAGGWKNDAVLKAIYAHAMEDKVREMDSVTVSHISKIMSTKPAHENEE